MPGFSPAILSYLVSGNHDASIQHVTLEDIPDPVLQEKLAKVSFEFVNLNYNVWDIVGHFGDSLITLIKLTHQLVLYVLYHLFVCLTADYL